MSLARVYTIQKAQKDQGVCQKCGLELKKGEPYVWFKVGFRSRHKNLRCTSAKCAPKQSERESSKAAAVYAAQEDFEANLPGLSDEADIADAVQTVAESIRELAEEYSEAADAWENGNEALTEKADHYESQASELEGWSWDGDVPYATKCDYHENWEEDDEGVAEDAIDMCASCQEMKTSVIEEIRESASDAVQNIETI